MGDLPPARLTGLAPSQNGCRTRQRKENKSILIVINIGLFKTAERRGKNEATLRRRIAVGARLHARSSTTEQRRRAAQALRSSDQEKTQGRRLTNGRSDDDH
jgi:hypothetical protein